MYSVKMFMCTFLYAQLLKKLWYKIALDSGRKGGVGFETNEGDVTSRNCLEELHAQPQVITQSVYIIANSYLQENGCTCAS